MEIIAETKEIEKMNWMDLILPDGFKSNIFQLPKMPLTSGKMTHEHESKIKKNLILLKKNIDAKELTDFFIQESIFDFPDVEKINGYNPNTQDNRNNCFFSILFQRGDTAYTVFLRALRENGQDFLANAIEQTTTTAGPNCIAPEDIRSRIQPAILQRRLEERDLSRLAQTLGSEWELVASEMGLSKAEIDHCKMDNPNAVMQIYSVLSKWKNRQASRATLDAFLNIVSSCQATTIDWVSMERVIGQFAN